MPRNSSGNKAVPRRFKSKRKTSLRKTKRQPSRSTSNRNPFAALVLTGVRSLIAALPGSAFLRPITDLFFTSIGLSEQSITEAASAVGVKEISFYGMSGMTAISYANILARASSTARNITKGPRLWFDTPYTDAKLENVSLTILPDTKIQSRSGRWACAFIPFRNVNDLKEILGQYRPLTISEVQALAGSVTSSADKPLHLMFRPKPEDGYCYQYNNIATYFGIFIISYSEEIRTAYHEFNADDFAPNITLRGAVKVRQPRMDGTTNGYEDATFAYTTLARASVYSTKTKTWLTYGEKNFVCTESDKKCNTSGTKWERSFVIPTQQHLSLESMAIE
jgi:hypothetical protein